MERLKQLGWIVIHAVGMIASSAFGDDRVPVGFSPPKRFETPIEFRRVTLSVDTAVSAAPAACPKDATVIIEASDKTHSYYGSGTVVAIESGSSIILSCAHLFHGLTDPEIIVIREKKRLIAKLSKVDEKNDLSTITVEAELPSVDVSKEMPVVGDKVVSVGRAAGDTVEERTHIVTAIEEGYIDTDGKQVEGRSGGGLFLNGELVGVIQGNRRDNGRSTYGSLKPIRRIIGRSLMVCESCVIEQYGSGEGRRIVKAYSPQNYCKNCKAYREKFGDGSADTKIEWTDDALPEWIRKKLPRGYEFPVFVWQTSETQYQWPQSSHGITLDLLDKWTEDSNAFREAGQDTVGSVVGGASLHGRAVIAHYLGQVFEFTGPSTFNASLHREGGLEALPIKGNHTIQDVFGKEGRFDFAIKATNPIPVSTANVEYRWDQSGKLFLRNTDWIEITIPKPGEQSHTVGSPLLIAYTVVSLGYDIYVLFHPTIDLWLGDDVSFTGTIEDSKVAIQFTGNQPKIRAAWNFAFGYLRFELSRPVTGVIVSPDECQIQFHKSRIYRDVTLPVKD